MKFSLTVLEFFLLWVVVAALPQAFGNITLEVAVGSLPGISNGDVGVVVADRAGNGFQNPQSGVVLTPGESVGPTDDIIVALFRAESGAHWQGGTGYSGFVTQLDLDEFSVPEGAPLKFFWLPGKNPDDTVMEGEMWHCFREDAAGESGGIHGFFAPSNYGVYRIAQISTDLGGDYNAGDPSQSGEYGEGDAHDFVMNVMIDVSVFNQITLNWTGVMNAESYNLYRGTSDDFGDAVYVGNTADATYTDDGLLGGKYFYWIEAIFASGTSIALSEAPDAIPGGQPRPDLTVGKKFRQTRGFGVSSSNPRGQTIKIRTKRFKGFRVFNRLYNTGTAHGEMRIRSNRARKGFRVRYQSISAPRQNITAALKTFRYFSPVNMGQVELIRAKVKPTRKLPDRNTRTKLVVSAVSVDVPSRNDIVKVKVKRDKR